jgi:ribosomal protein S18 acetylase RimI-like enzyme
MSEHDLPRLAIRDAAPGDLETVVHLDEVGTGLAKPDYWRDMFDRYAAEARPGRFFLIAETGNQVAGFIVGEIRTWEFGSPPCGWVFAVNVAPEVRERGVGSHLFEEICRRFAAAGVDTVRTMISRHDALNLSFFRGLGLTAGPYIELERQLT